MPTLLRARPRAVIISAVHDYRMKRRGSIQAIADALVRAGHETHFVSVRFSPLSLMKQDPRAFLWGRANRCETQGGVHCYLWRTPFHPFITGAGVSDVVMAPLHDVYAQWPNAWLDRILADADLVIVESGLSVMLIERARRLNARGKVIYIANDALDVIGAHPYIKSALARARPMIDRVFLRSARMAPDFAWAEGLAYIMPTGLHPPDFADIGPSPYAGGVNAVSVGSMLFDESFFTHAAAAFPEVRFHVIGCGQAFSAAPANVFVYPETPFRETLPFIAHARFGVAPYRDAENATYLTESSLKLMQYDYLGLPAVCPYFAAGEHPRRYGYQPGNAAQISSAVAGALADRATCAPRPTHSWDDVILRLIDPRDFADTAIAHEAFANAPPYKTPRAA
jgi:2-beta-glucuronyltransferase